MSSSTRGLAFVGRLGLAGRTGFYLILTGITIRLATVGSAPQADAHGALAIVGKPLIGKVAIGAVALGFVLFGVGRLVGAWQDDSVSGARRAMTVVQGVFYLALAYVPAAFLAGRTQTGSQQEQQKTTGQVLGLPGGRAILIGAGVVVMAVCAQQIKGALERSFEDGLDLARAPRVVRAVAGRAGVVGIVARALVFLPIGIFLVVAAFADNPSRSYGTDSELLKVAEHPWGVAVLAAVAAGLAVFTVFSGIETAYRDVVSAR